MIGYEEARYAVIVKGTRFFDADLNPVVPEVGQWFCEFDINDDPEVDDLRDEALVEYVGEGRVQSEYDESDRAPRGFILVRQS